MRGGLLGMAMLLATTSPAVAATCESLMALALPNTTLTGAEVVDGVCRVNGSVRTSADSSIRIAVWMPEQWNEKFLATGYAFFGNAMNPAPLQRTVAAGYATATTDNGLPPGMSPQDGSFLRGHPERVIDWGERAWHETVVRAKAIITAYYGRAPRYSYFNGAGGAGRQGLKAVQRFPGDFDGVVVGGVAADSTHFSLANLWAWLAANKDEASRIPASKLPSIHRAAVAACDADDGATDGLISDPERCTFDPVALQCLAGDAADCLTAPQVRAVRAIYAPPTHARTGRRLFGPLMRGSELGWGGVVGERPNGYAVEFFRSIVFQDPAWDPRSLNFDGDVAAAEKVPAAVNAVDPDISQFVARGGKLLMYGGWADTAINPGAQTDYYKAVVARLGAVRARGAVRLYMLPMMGHFLGGNGPHTYELDTQALIERWVEQKTPPAALEVAHKANGVQDRTVRVCPYPDVLCRAQTTTAAAPSPAMRLIEQAAAAMGGRAQILAVRTLTIEGYATNPNLGQQMTPDSQLLLWMIPDYTRRLDLANSRMELAITRRPAFPAVFDNARAVQRLDGDVAYNVLTNQPRPARLSEAATKDRRLEMLHHPLTALRAALDPASTLGNHRTSATRRSVDITTAKGDTITLSVDAQGRPVSVQSMHYHPNLGDVARVTTFGAYAALEGLRLPKRIGTTIDRWTEWDIGVMKHTLDADLDLAAPEETRAAAPAAAIPPQNVPVTEVAAGIWFVTGAGVPSLVVEFTDHVALVEVPASEARTQAVMARARELVPGKPLTQAIVTHHHFDHTAGLRAAVAEGLTIITHRVNENWFREMVKRKHSIVVDALARAPKPLEIVTFDDAHTLRDAAMELQLVHLRNSTHGDGIIGIYFPRERLFAEADVWNPGAQIQPHVRSLDEEIRRRGLQIERIVPLHGQQVQPWAAFEKELMR